MNGELALNLPISALIAEYEDKVEKADKAIDEFKSAISDIEYASRVRGCYGESVGSFYPPSVDHVKKCLSVSAWRYVYAEKNLSLLMTASERAKFERDLTDPPEFTMDNIRATFGDMVSNPRMAILKGLAEVFCQLDDSYKSHSKVKIGVKCLPKRVIISGWDSHYTSDRPVNLINALRLVQGRSMINRNDLRWNVNGCQEITDSERRRGYSEGHVVEGLSFKKFINGNLHIIFDKDTCLDINRALAEYYGDVLPDVEEHGQKSSSTAVSKDLAYYPTPKDVAASLVRDCDLRNKTILEPSCGDGNLIDAIKELSFSQNAQCKVFGYEVHLGRASEARSKGHSVVAANFLDVPPSEEFDLVIMNPPFAGRHYLKHIRHAIKFLKPGGVLKSILPATAWYDHGELPEQTGSSFYKWRDLPVGSFSESGTNVPTGIWTFTKKS